MTKLVNHGFAQAIDLFVVLEGKHVRLEPMMLEHLPALCEAGMHEDLWRWTTTSATTESGMREYVEAAIALRDQGLAVPFVTVDKGSDQIVGSTRFGNIDSHNRKVEIGWTWLTPSAQRTQINSEAKLLMLTYAFDILGCVRVELKTDALNDKSRNAMLRLGCREEGILRSHMITHTGRMRDSVYFSILTEEWPPIRENLLVARH